VGLHPVNWPYDSKQVWDTEIGGKQVRVQDWVSPLQYSLLSRFFCPIFFILLLRQKLDSLHSPFFLLSLAFPVSSLPHSLNSLARSPVLPFHPLKILSSSLPLPFFLPIPYKSPLSVLSKSIQTRLSSILCKRVLGKSMVRQARLGVQRG